MIMVIIVLLSPAGLEVLLLVLLLVLMLFVSLEEVLKHL